MRKFSALYLLLFIFIRASAAHADDLAAVKAQIAAAKKQDAAIAGKIKDNEKIVLRTKKELVKTAAKLSDIEEEKQSVGDEIRALQSKKDALAKQIAANSARLDDAAAALAAVAIAPPRFDSAGDYAVSMAALAAVAERFDADMRIARAEFMEMDRLQTMLEKQHGNFAAVEKKHKREKAELDKLLRARADQNQTLRGRQYDLQKKLGDLSARAKNLSDLANRVAAPGARASSPSDDAPGRVFGLARGKKMRFPAGGMLLLRFGEYNASGLKSDGWRVRTRGGAVVAAPADGRIEFADWFHRTRVAIISHGDGYITLMTGMDSLSVMPGQDVLAGEPIGRMPEKNPEVYLELRRGSHAIDPAKLFIEPK